MLPGRVVGRAWSVPGFLPHAMFKTDFFAHALTGGVLPSQRRRQRAARWKAIRSY